METHTAASRTLRLPPGTVHRIDAAHGSEIRVVRGRVWLTVSGLADDFVLIAGDRFRVPHAGRIVIESWPDRAVDRSTTAVVEFGSHAHAPAPLVPVRA